MSINPKLDGSDYTILKRRHDSLFQVPIKSSAFDSWKCLNPHIPRDKAYDCTIQTFHFLDIIKDRKLAEHIAKIVHKQKGTRTIEYHQIPYIFKYVADIYHVVALPVDYVFSEGKPFHIWYEILDKKLKQGYGTIINGRRIDSGHSFVVGKDKNGTLYVWDPQKDFFDIGYDALLNYFIKQKFYAIFYITKKADKPRRSSKSNSSSSSHRITKKHKKDKQTIEQEKKKRKITIKKNKEAREKRKQDREKRKQDREKRIQVYAMKKKQAMDISSPKSSSSHRMDISSPSSISSKKSKKKRKKSTSLLNNRTKKQRTKRQVLIDRFRYRVSDSESL